MSTLSLSPFNALVASACAEAATVPAACATDNALAAAVAFVPSAVVALVVSAAIASYTPFEVTGLLLPSVGAESKVNVSCFVES